MPGTERSEGRIISKAKLVPLLILKMSHRLAATFRIHDTKKKKKKKANEQTNKTQKETKQNLNQATLAPEL